MKNDYISEIHKKDKLIPIVENNEIKISNTIIASLSADHRVLDGAIAAKLLKDFKKIIEDPLEIWINSNEMKIN